MFLVILLFSWTTIHWNGYILQFFFQLLSFKLRNVLVHTPTDPHTRAPLVGIVSKGLMICLCVYLERETLLILCYTTRETEKQFCGNLNFLNDFTCLLRTLESYCKQAVETVYHKWWDCIRCETVCLVVWCVMSFKSWKNKGCCCFLVAIVYYLFLIVLCVWSMRFQESELEQYSRYVFLLLLGFEGNFCLKARSSSSCKAIQHQSKCKKQWYY